MLRFTILLVLLHNCNSNLSGQDLLITSKGDSIYISYAEINEKFLVYKKLNSENILASKYKNLNRIVYENGDMFLFKKNKMIRKPKTKKLTKEQKKLAKEVGLLEYRNEFWIPSIAYHGGKLSTQSVMDVYFIMQNEEAFNTFMRGRRLTKIGNILVLPSSLFFGYQLYRIERGNRKILFASAILTVISMSMNGIGSKMIKNSVRNYNHTISLHLEGTSNGFGMVLKF